MVIKIPLLASLSASRKIQTGAQAGQSIPLRQLPARARHAAGGSLPSQGAASAAATPLQQGAASTTARSGKSLRQSLTRLRDKLHRERTPSPRPQTPPQAESSRFTRSSAQGRTPGEPSRAPSTNLPPRDAAPDTSGFTRASARDRDPATLSRRPSTPPTPPNTRTASPERRSHADLAANAIDLAFQTYQNTVRTIPPDRPTASSPAEQPETPPAAPPMSEKARGKQPMRESEPERDPPGPQGSASARKKLAQPPNLATIKEEQYAELKRSELNATQQVAFDAARRDTAEHHTRLRPQIASLALDARGKLNVTDAVSENLRNILNETVARPQHTWQAHQANSSNSQHLLMDTHGRLFSLQGSKTAFVGLTQSVPMESWKQAEPSRLDRAQDKLGLKTLTSRSDVKIQLHNAGTATVRAPARLTGGPAVQRTVLLPDAAVHAALTGIFAHDREQGEKGAITETVSEHIREHGGRLYRLDERAMHWDEVDENEEKSYSKLTKQADETLYAIHDKKTLHNLSTGEKSKKFDDKIAGYCTSQRGETLVTLTNEKTNKQSVMFLTRLGDDKSRHFPLALKTTDASGASVDFHSRGMTIHDGQVFAIDSNGKLFTGPLPQAGDKQMPLTAASERTAELTGYLGESFTLDSFLNHGSGRLLAVVKDASDQRHVCALDQQGQFRPQWNLSESLVMDHHEGLLQPRPLPQDVVDLGRLGQMMLHEGKIYVMNKNSGRWEASSESATSLKRGQDGQAYIINDDGLPARVKVSLKSDKIGGVNNQFVMRQMKSSVTADLPLPGFSQDNKPRAIAPVDAQKLAAISDKNEIQYHQNQADSRQPAKMMQTLTKAGIGNHLPHVDASTANTLAATGEGNELVDITCDQKQNLYVLDKQGKLYTMPKEDWQAAPGTRPNASWQPVDLPPELGEIEHLHNMAGGGLMVSDKAGRSASLQLAGMRLGATVVDNNATGSDAAEASGSAAVTNQNAQQIASHNRWLVQPEYDPDTKLEAKSHRRRVEKALERLDEASKSVNVHGMTLKGEVNLMGMTGRDGNHVNSGLRDRLRAHVLDVDFSRAPRPTKTVWRSAVHSWKGRAELEDQYQYQNTLHQQMKAALAAPPAAPLTPLADRLKALENGPFDRAFMEHVNAFCENVADSARHQATLLGQHSGALEGDGSVKTQFEPSRRKALTQSMNPYSDKENLVQDLARFHAHYPLSAGQGSPQLMSALEQKGVVVHHQKAQAPMGRQRDPHDDMGLTKSRLILDGLTMKALHELVDEMESAAAESPVNLSRINTAKEAFRVLRDEDYGDDPIQKATSMGFVNNKQLEACYDAIRTMTNAFSKPHHGVNVTTRTVMKASTQEQMTERMFRTISSLESGENMGFGRNYGGMLTLSVIPGGEIIGVPGVRGNLDRAYNASFARSDSGITVTFSRNGGGTGTAFGAVGWNPLSQAPNPGQIKADLGNNRSITPSARLNGIIALALQRQMQNSVSFTVSEANLQEFLEKLTSGQLDPASLLESGVSHRVKNGTILTFNVDATAMAMAGGGLNLPTSQSDPTKNRALVRANVSVQAAANLASAQRERNVTRSSIGSTSAQSDNRLRMLNSVSVGAGIMGGVGVTTGGPQTTRIPVFGINSTNIQASIDNRTKQSMSLDIGRAEPVAKKQLDKLIEQVESGVDEPKINALLQELKDADKPPKEDLPSLTPELKALKEQSLRDRATSHTLRPLSATERKAYEKLLKEDNAAAEQAEEIAEIAARGGPKAIMDTPANKTPEAPKKNSEKFSTFLKPEKEAVNMKLDKLLPTLLAMTPTNNAQYAVLNAARQLEVQQKAAALRSHALNSAEYQSTYNNLHKIDHDNLMHVIHSLFASELPESNAAAISRFMAEKPMLKEVVRELQKNRNTQASVTLEFVDDTRYRMQQQWLDHQTRPEDIQALLKDRSQMRVKSISFTETDTKQEGFNLPLLVAGASSQASVSIARNLGKINFSYGADQRTPNAFTLEGEIADASQAVVNALTSAEVQDKRGVL